MIIPQPTYDDMDAGRRADVDRLLAAVRGAAREMKRYPVDFDNPATCYLQEALAVYLREISYKEIPHSEVPSS